MNFDLFKYSLKNFYPKSKITYDDEEYLSLEDNYKNWLNPVYINGNYYLGIEDDKIPVLKTMERSMGDTGYIIPDDDILRFALKLNNFDSSQKISLIVFYFINDYNEEYMISEGIFSNDYVWIPLSDEITWENIQRIMVERVPLSVLNHVEYSAVSSKNFLKNDNLSLISKEEFDNLKNNSGE